MARLMLGRGGVVGIDVGSSAIKVIHAELTGDGILVRNAFTVDTPEGAVREGLVMEPMDIGETIRAKLKDYQVSAKTAVASISGATVMVRPARVPQMAEKLLRKSIRYEAARYISTSIEESAVEFDIVNADPGDGEMEVLLVAAPESMVMSMATAIEAAGLDAVAVDLDGFAMYRTLVETNGNMAGEGKTIVMLDLGASHTDVHIISGGTFVLSRTLPICGDSLTRAVEPLTSGDRPAAERLKRDIDLAARPPEAGAKDPPEIRAARAIVPLLEEMVREIKRSIQYYNLSDQAEGRAESQIDQVILGGGGARLAGLAEFLTAKLETPVSVGRPLDARVVTTDPAMLSLEETLREGGPVYATALGLAMKEHPMFASSKRVLKAKKTAPKAAASEAAAPATDEKKPTDEAAA